MDIQTLVSTYETPQHAVELVRSANIVLLVGIAGAGKDTIKQKLLDSRQDYVDIVSHTTRAPRINNGVQETEGLDYHFTSIDQAKEMLLNKEFIEAKYVHGTIYGTSAQSVQRAVDTHKIAITDLDVQGVAEYKTIAQEVRALFILPPDYATWMSRLQSRYHSEEAFATEWPKRRTSAISELSHALEVPYYHFIINDDLERAVRVVDEIAHSGDIFNRHDDEARLAARDLLDVIKKSN